MKIYELGMHTLILLFTISDHQNLTGLVT